MKYHQGCALPGIVFRTGAHWPNRHGSGTRRFENHLTYYDVHCVFEGVERVEVAALGSLTPSTVFGDVNDIGFLDGDADASVLLRPGRFLACFPEDAHKPGMWIDGPATLRKVVA